MWYSTQPEDSSCLYGQRAKPGFGTHSWRLEYGAAVIRESFRFEQTFKIIKSNCRNNPVLSASRAHLSIIWMDGASLNFPGLCSTGHQQRHNWQGFQIIVNWQVEEECPLLLLSPLSEKNAITGIKLSLMEGNCSFASSHKALINFFMIMPFVTIVYIWVTVMWVGLFHKINK